MKKTTLLFLASLAVLATGASAASSQNESDVFVLPTYVVAIPRNTPVEDQINASLKAFVQQAAAPMVIAPELTLRKALPLAGATQPLQALRLAKS